MKASMFSTKKNPTLHGRITFLYQHFQGVFVGLSLQQVQNTIGEEKNLILTRRLPEIKTVGTCREAFSRRKNSSSINLNFQMQAVRFMEV